MFLINSGGSFLPGVLLAEDWGHPGARLLLHDAGGIGFCGGLTTFSTYAVDVVDLLDPPAPGTGTFGSAPTAGLGRTMGP